MRLPHLTLALCLTVAPALGQPLEQIKVVNHRAPDCSSLKSIVETVTRGCKTDDQRAIAIYNFCRYDHYHHAYPSEPGGISTLKLVNVYGWGLCGGQHTVMAALWEAAGYKWRYRG
ncbi:MAG: transglutaminase domain-containing protein, partial [Planctomycetota bacterium]